MVDRGGTGKAAAGGHGSNKHAAPEGGKVEIYQAIRDHTVYIFYRGNTA